MDGGRVGYARMVLQCQCSTLFTFIIIFFFVFYIVILLTGERSNSIKAIFGIILFLSITDILKLKIKILVFFILIGSIILIISNSNYLKNRYYGQLYKEAFIEKDTLNFLKKILI